MRNPSTPPPPDLASALDDLASACASPEGFTIEEIQERLAERTWPLLVLLFALPFASPIPLPGLSTPFGIGIAAIGFAWMLGKTPALPVRVRRMRCPPGLFARIIAHTAKLLAHLRALARPRWQWFSARRGARILGGCIIGLSGLLLALPLPIPFSNAVPAYAILLTSIGLSQRDGLILLLGQLTFLGAVMFFTAICWGVLWGVRVLIG